MAHEKCSVSDRCQERNYWQCPVFDSYSAGLAIQSAACERARNRNSEALTSFVDYCNAHPDQRFWQALLNWSGLSFLLSSSGSPADIKQTCPHLSSISLEDTYYWEGGKRGTRGY